MSIELIECPQCGVVDEVGVNFKHDDECPMLCGIEGCNSIAVRSVWVDDGVQATPTPLCRRHLKADTPKVIHHIIEHLPTWREGLE